MANTATKIESTEKGTCDFYKFRCRCDRIYEYFVLQFYKGGALEALAKCLRIEYAKDNITFHIMHPPLTRTESASPLPVPDEFKALPEKVGYGLAEVI